MYVQYHCEMNVLPRDHNIKYMYGSWNTDRGTMTVTMIMTVTMAMAMTMTKTM